MSSKMLFKKQLPFISIYIFRSVALTIFMIALVQSFKPPSNKNINNTHKINNHIIKKLTLNSIRTIHQWNLYYLKRYTTLNYHTPFSEDPPFFSLTVPKMH